MAGRPAAAGAQPPLLTQSLRPEFLLAFRAVSPKPSFSPAGLVRALADPEPIEGWGFSNCLDQCRLPPGAACETGFLGLHLGKAAARLTRPPGPRSPQAPLLGQARPGQALGTV